MHAADKILPRNLITKVGQLDQVCSLLLTLATWPGLARSLLSM